MSYHYITPEEFQDLLRQDALMEYNLYAGGDYYGTPAQPVYDVLARAVRRFWMWILRARPRCWPGYLRR